MSFWKRFLVSIGLRKHEWFDGPAELKEHTKRAVNVAIAEIERRHGIRLKFRWDKDTLKIREGKIRSRDRRGLPLINPDGDDSQEYGSYLPRQRQSILPRGCTFGTLVHEIGHDLLHKAGYPPSNHHSQFRNFFRTFTGRNGGGGIW